MSNTDFVIHVPQSELVVAVYGIGTATVQKIMIRHCIKLVLLQDTIKKVGKEFLNIEQLCDPPINNKWDITNMGLTVTFKVLYLILLIRENPTEQLHQVVKTHSLWKTHFSIILHQFYHFKQFKWTFYSNL